MFVGENKPPLPLSCCLSSKHKASDIEEYIKRSRTLIKTVATQEHRPQQIVTDFSMANIHAILGAYNLGTVCEYLNNSYENPDTIEIKIKLCCAHLMKAFATQTKKYIQGKQERKLINTLFAELQETKSKHDLDRSFSNLVRILLGKEGAAIGFENTAEDVNVESGITLDKDGKRYCDRTIPGRHFSRLAESIETESNKTPYNKILICPHLVNYLVVYIMPFCGLWSSTISKRVSNSLIENWHRTLKIDIFSKRVPVSEFVETLYGEMKGRVNEYVRPDVQAKKRAYNKKKCTGKPLKKKSDNEPKEECLTTDIQAKKRTHKKKDVADPMKEESCKEPEENWCRRSKQQRTYYQFAKNLGNMGKKVHEISASVLRPKKKPKITKAQQHLDNERNNSEKRNAEKDKSSSACTTQPDIMDGLKKDVDIITISDDDECTVVSERQYPNVKPEEKLELLTPGTWVSSDIINPFLESLKNVDKKVIVYDAFSVYHDKMQLTENNSKFIAVINSHHSAKKYKCASSKGLGNHWICLSNMQDNNEGATAHISVYDSLQSQSTSTDVKERLLNLFNQLQTFTKVNIKYRKIQQQLDSASCGLHALAIATQLQYGKNPELCKIKLDYMSMRKYIANCLDNRKATLFPTVEEWDHYKEHDRKRVCVHGEAKNFIETLSLRKDSVDSAP